MSEGRKDDQGKVELDLIPYESLKEIAKVLMFGKKKYGKWNWQKGLDTDRIINALLRHSHSYASGETIDSETGLSHAAHAACNAIFLLWYESQQIKNEETLDALKEADDIISGRIESDALTVRELIERIVDARD